VLPSCNQIHSLVYQTVFYKGKSDQLYEPQDCIWTLIYFDTNHTIWMRAVTLSGNKQKGLTSGAMFYTGMSGKSTPLLVFKDAQEILTATHIYLLPSNPTELLPLFLTMHDNNQVLLIRNNQNLGKSWVITDIAALLEKQWISHTAKRYLLF